MAVDDSNNDRELRSDATHPGRGEGAFIVVVVLIAGSVMMVVVASQKVVYPSVPSYVLVRLYGGTGIRYRTQYSTYLFMSVRIYLMGWYEVVSRNDGKFLGIEYF